MRAERKTSKIKQLSANGNLILIFAYLLMNVSTNNDSLNCIRKSECTGGTK